MKPTHIKQFIPIPSIWQWLCGVLIIMVSFAYYFFGKMDMGELMPKHTILYGALVPFAFAYLQKRQTPNPISLKIVAGIVAFLISQFITIGSSIYHTHDWSLCFGDGLALLIWALQSICYWYVCYKIIIGIYCLIEYSKKNEEEYSFHLTRWFFLIFFIHLLFFSAFFPCIFDIDSAIGMRTFLDPDSATCNHHPYFVQWLHASSFEFGQNIGHSSWGFAILTLLSICLASGILTYGIKLIARSGIGKKWTSIAALIFVFFPLFPYLSVHDTKDGLFAYAFLLYIFTLYELYLSKGNCLNSVRFSLLHGAAILLVCLTRHQGIYIVVLESVFLLLCYKSQWIKVLGTTVPSLALFLCYNNILLPKNNVEPGGKQEIYSTFFHQTANYYRLYQEEITPQEHAVIGNILDEELLVKNYRHNLTDGAKDHYTYNPMVVESLSVPVYFRHVNREHEDEDLKAYRSTWFSMFRKHPSCYIEAWLTVISGFFYNNDEPLVKVEPHWAIAPFAITPEYLFEHNSRIETQYYLRSFHWVRKPISSWFISIPYYIWTSIILLALLLYRKDLKGLSIFLPMILSVALLIICPIASGRYAFPIVVALPLLLIYLISTNKKDICQK